MEVDRSHGTAKTTQRFRIVAGHEIPQPHRLIVAPGNKAATIGTEGDRQDPTVVAS
jgi:hypothetical protein